MVKPLLITVAVAVTVAVALLSCATPKPTPVAPEAEKEATAKSEAACKKMCEVAGDAEENVAAVAACQQKCTP